MLSIIMEALLLLPQIIVIYAQTIYRLVFGRPRKAVRGKTILITGAAQGIGKEMATRFCRLGANLALIDINEKSLLQVVQDLRDESAKDPQTGHGSGCKIAAYRCDLSHQNETETVAKRILDDFAHIDILINNAGIVRCTTFDQLTANDIRRTFDVNVLSQFWLNKPVLSCMIKRRSGQIVAIASIAGLTGTANLVDYCSSKFAVVGMMEALEYELERFGNDCIKLTTICPIAFSSGMFKNLNTRFAAILPIMTPEYTAEKAIDAILTEQSLVTIPGSIYYAFYLAGKLVPDKARNLIRNFVGYNVEKHD